MNDHHDTLPAAWPDYRVAYDLPEGRAWYVDGSLLAGQAMYELGGQIYTWEQIQQLRARAGQVTKAAA